mmetsp:Transcript_6371/g.11088  ORF Transcript_6371/g.11088 Transcript_6371/m.11088 type:complete len:243 (+) Transcript_6371:939-1667(+)
MGGCSNRPTIQQTAEHLKHEDHTNDHRFVVIPDLNKMSLASADSFTLANQLKLLKLKKSVIKARLETLECLINCTSCLLVEIRKGKDIFPQESCFKSAGIRIRARLSPGGPSFETPKSTTVIPKWYRLFEVKQSVTEYTAIDLDILVDYSSDSLLYGTSTIRMNDLISQECYKEWIPIVTSGVAKESSSQGFPMLEVRVQYLHDEKEVFQRYNDTIQEMITHATKLLSRGGVNVQRTAVKSQ